jgi:hypothetical protein
MPHLRNRSIRGIATTNEKWGTELPTYTVWMLQKQNITVSNGGSLDGLTQGEGTHLLGQTITLNSNAWLRTSIEDLDSDFEDNDAGQVLDGAQTIDNTLYLDGTQVEAEYRITFTDGTNTWTAYAYNVNNSAPTYATIEGLVFLPNAQGDFPPIGIPLTVTTAAEGPEGGGSNPYILYQDPPCFTLGTLIDTPTGPRPVEALQPGDMVLTRDNGPQPLRWVGRVDLGADHLARHPEHQPVEIAAGTLSPGLPLRDLRLSPQHRVLLTGWKAELMFAEDEVLVPATALRNDQSIRTKAADAGVTYLHLLLDRHEIIFAEGAPVESLLADWLVRGALPPAQRAELEALFPQLFEQPGNPAPARPCLTVKEGRILAI